MDVIGFCHYFPHLCYLISVAANILLVCAAGTGVVTWILIAESVLNKIWNRGKKEAEK